MNENQARRAVQLADERNAILRDLDLLTDPESNLHEGGGLVIVTKGLLPVMAVIDGVTVPHTVTPGGTRLTASIPRLAFDAALQAMVTASQDRVLAINAELHELGVKP